MKIEFSVTYDEGYIPPKCRKMRYINKKENIFTDIKDVKKSELATAFYSEGSVIYKYYNGLII